MATKKSSAAAEPKPAAKPVVHNSPLLAKPTGKTQKLTSTTGNVFLAPVTLAAIADRMYQVRQLRYAQVKIVAQLQDEETTLAEYLIKNLPKSDATGAVGKLAKATISSGKKKPRVVDWDKVWGYIIRNKATDLLQRRLSDEAVTARWESGKKIPGVEEYDVTTVSLNKI